MTNGFGADFSTSFLTASILVSEDFSYLSSGTLIREKDKMVEWRKKVDAPIEDISGALVAPCQGRANFSYQNYVNLS